MAIDEKKLIDADKLIEDLTEWFSGKVTYCLEYGYDDLREDIEDCFDAFTDIIESQPKLDVPDNNVGKWIPVTERLPEDEGNYLVTCKGRHNGFLEIVQFRFQQFMICLDLCEVIAWYDEPLPEPYKG